MPEAQGPAHGLNPVLLINKADWQDAIASYLKGEELEDLTEAKRLQHGTRNYYIINDLLYKGASVPPVAVRIVRGRPIPPLRDSLGAL